MEVFRSIQLLSWSEEILCLLWIQKSLLLHLQNLPMERIVSQSPGLPTASLGSIVISSHQLPSKWSFLHHFKILYSFLIFPINATCPYHLIFHDIILTVVWHQVWIFRNFLNYVQFKLANDIHTSGDSNLPKSEKRCTEFGEYFKF